MLLSQEGPQITTRLTMCEVELYSENAKKKF